MIVIDLHCTNGHHFEGWFGSATAFEEQLARRLVSCPVCGATAVRRLPSAPYVQTGHATAEKSSAIRAPQPAAAAQAPAVLPAPEALVRLMTQLRGMARSAEDVGERLPEEARRMHYGETEARDIRGSASADEVESLLEEGILVLPVPPAEEDLH